MKSGSKSDESAIGGSPELAEFKLGDVSGVGRGVGNKSAELFKYREHVGCSSEGVVAALSGGGRGMVGV